MGAGTEASFDARRSVRLRQPAYGQHSYEPEVEGQKQGGREEAAGDERLGRVVGVVHLPILLAVALLQVGWLIALGYAAIGIALHSNEGDASARRLNSLGRQGLC